MILNSKAIARDLQPEFHGLLILVMAQGKTWVIVILGSFVALIPDFIFEFVKVVFFPSPTDKVMSLLKDKSRIFYDTVITARNAQD